MKAITLRNLPPDIARAIRRTRRIKNISANQAVIGLLEKNTRAARQKRPALHHDLDQSPAPGPKAKAMPSIEH